MELVQYRWNHLERLRWTLGEHELELARWAPGVRVRDAIPYQYIGRRRVEIDEHSVKALWGAVVMLVLSVALAVLRLLGNRDVDPWAWLIWLGVSAFCALAWWVSRTSWIVLTGPSSIQLLARSPSRERVEAFLAALAKRQDEVGAPAPHRRQEDRPFPN